MILFGGVVTKPRVRGVRPKCFNETWILHLHSIVAPLPKIVTNSCSLRYIEDQQSCVVVKKVGDYYCLEYEGKSSGMEIDLTYNDLVGALKVFSCSIGVIQRLHVCELFQLVYKASNPGDFKSVADLVIQSLKIKFRISVARKKVLVSEDIIIESKPSMVEFDEFAMKDEVEEEELMSGEVTSNIAVKNSKKRARASKHLTENNEICEKVVITDGGEVKEEELMSGEVANNVEVKQKKILKTKRPRALQISESEVDEAIADKIKIKKAKSDNETAKVIQIATDNTDTFELSDSSVEIIQKSTNTKKKHVPESKYASKIVDKKASSHQIGDPNSPWFYNLKFKQPLEIFYEGNWIPGRAVWYSRKSKYGNWKLRLHYSGWSAKKWDLDVELDGEIKDSIIRQYSTLDHLEIAQVEILDGAFIESDKNYYLKDIEMLRLMLQRGECLVMDKVK